MAFTTENRSIQELFQNRSTFDVPRYQREYVWEKKNWEDLYNDIDFTVENNQEWSHFLGTIVLNLTEVSNGVNKYDVVDGQQRLTTLYVLLHSIYERFILLEEDDYKQRALAMKDFLFSKDYSNNSLKKISNPKFENTLSQICTYTSHIDEFEITESDNITQAFLYFQSIWKQKDGEYIKKFLSALLSIKIVEIISSEEEEIYNIFEVLNARGKQLKQIELLQNHVLKYVSPREHLDVAKEKFNTIFETIAEKDQEDFLFHFNKSFLKQKFPQKDTYSKMKLYIPITELSVLLDELVNYAGVYNEILNNTDSFDIEYFNITRNKQVRPFLCSLMLKKDLIGANNYTHTVRNLRNFLFVYNVVGQTANTTDSIIKDHAYKLFHASDKNESLVIINDFFKTLVEKYESSMTKARFKSEIKNGNKYSYSNKYRNHKSKGKLVKYVLVAFNNQFSDIDITIAQMSALTIEHLLGDTAYESKNQSITRVTLADARINSSQLANKELIEKLNILENSSLYNNRLLNEYVNGTDFNWDGYTDDFIDKLYNQTFKFTKRI